MSTYVLSYRLMFCHVSASYEFKIDRGGGEAREYAQTTECNQQRPPQGNSLLHIPPSSLFSLAPSLPPSLCPSISPSLLLLVFVILTL